MWRLGLRAVWASRTVFTLALLAVGIGVAFVTAVLSVTDTFGAATRDTYARAYSGSDLVVVAREPVVPTGMPGDWKLDESVVDTVAGLDGVATAEGFTQVEASLLGRDGEAAAASEYLVRPFAGGWIGAPALNPFRLAAGAPPRTDGEVAIDLRSARRAGYAVGDRVRVRHDGGTVEARISGVVRFGSADSPGGVGVVFFTAARAQALAAAPGRVDQIHVAVEPDADPASVRAAIEALPDAGAGRQVLTGREFLASVGLDAEAGLRRVRSRQLGGAAFAVVAGGFVIYSSFAFVAARRRRELAMLRTIGASRAQVVRLVVGEAAAVGVVASFAGWLSGLAVAAGMVRVLDARDVVPVDGSVVIEAHTAGVAFAVGVGIAVACAALPALAVFRLPPLAAVAETERPDHPRIWRRAAVSVVLAAAAVGLAAIRPPAMRHDDRTTEGLVLGLALAAVLAGSPLLVRCLSRCLSLVRAPLHGVAARLAVTHVTAVPRRVAATVAPVIVGVAIGCFSLVHSASMREDARVAALSVQEAADADYVIAEADLPHDVTDRLAALPEVEVAAGFAGAAVRAGGRDASAVATRPRALAQIFDLRVTAGGLADLDDDGVAVSSAFAAAARLRTGAALAVQFGTGPPVALRVRALYEPHPAVRADLIVVPELLAARAPSASDYEIWIKLADGVTPARAEAAFGPILQPYPAAAAVTLAESARVAGQERQRTAVLNQVLLALTVVVAAAGVTNGAVLAAVDRRREHALLRAVGATRAQVAATLCGEAFIVTAIGSVIAVGVGVGLAYGLIRLDSDINAFHIPAGAICTVTGGLLAIVTLVSTVPAHWAAGRSIIDALGRAA